MISTLRDGVTVEAIVSAETVYQIDGTPTRPDAHGRVFQPSTATVLSLDGVTHTITVGGRITRGVFSGSLTAVEYRVLDGESVVGNEHDQSPPYWVQEIADMHRPNRVTSV